VVKPESSLAKNAIRLGNIVGPDETAHWRGCAELVNLFLRQLMRHRRSFDCCRRDKVGGNLMRRQLERDEPDKLVKRCLGGPSVIMP
jgi:hypothetical protein